MRDDVVVSASLHRQSDMITPVGSKVPGNSQGVSINNRAFPYRIGNP
jgi:hypothetical protein